MTVNDPQKIIVQGGKIHASFVRFWLDGGQRPLSFVKKMVRVSKLLVLFLVVVILVSTEYMVILSGEMYSSLLTSGSIQYGGADPTSIPLLEQKMNRTLDEFMKSMTEKSIQKNDLDVILDKLRIIEVNIHNPPVKKSPSVNDVQEQLPALEETSLTRAEQQTSQAHETTSLEKSDLESLMQYISSVEQKVKRITDAHIASLGQPYSNEAFFGLNNETFCVPWEIDVDKWWTHSPDWSVSKENETHQCFSQMEDPEKAEFFRTLYDIQWNGNCSNVFTKVMWSAGWGADLRNVIDGLQEAVKTGQPMQMFTQQPWHYAHAAPDRSTCATKDYRCYFLDLGKCTPNQQSYASSLLNQKLLLDKNPGSWYYEYATRPKTWLRHKVLRFSSKINITTPCTVVHVRRADIVLHKNRIRRYHEIDDYVKRLNNDTKNIFLLTDDANAISEALYKFPEYNWMYIDRPRHKGAEGGFENQIPSKNPKFEVIVLLSIFQLVKKCATLIHTKSGFALLLRREMAQEGLRTINIGLGRPMYSNEYVATENVSKAYPIHIHDKR